MSIALLHFQPLENYPPVMNCIRDLEDSKVTELKIFSTYSQNNWFNSPYTIYRFGNCTASRWARYWTYLYFNLACFFFLCYYRPKKVLYYETYSSWPVYWYKKLFPSVYVFIHFHEYVSDKEKKESSAYFKYLLIKETAILKKAIWISHTNDDRMRLFQQDYYFVSKDQCHILPNYPPADWAARAQRIHTKRQVSVSKHMVYVGALGLETTYIKEIADWIEKQQGAITLNIYCNNVEFAVIEFLNKLNSSYITINKTIPYYELPELLANYDIGLVLYNGHIPNYVYNVPNKVFEYLACGLQVWYSEELVSTNKFKQEYDIQQLISINFTNLICLPEKSVFEIIDAPQKIYEKSLLVSKLIAA
jgi:hypothetical protein